MDWQFEVATFRSDGAYLDGRHPVEVNFSSPEEDARRRDFTINGMFFDPPNDAVIDFVGGRDDLAREGHSRDRRSGAALCGGPPAPPARDSFCHRAGV